MSTIVTVGCVAAMVSITSGIALGGNAVFEAHRARQSADLAALAAADTSMWRPRTIPCQSAASVTERNGFHLQRCACQATHCAVEVAFEVLGNRYWVRSVAGHGRDK